MTDINTKVILEVPLKQRGFEPPAPPSGPSSPEAIAKELQSVAGSNSANLNARDGGKQQAKAFTVMIIKASGEIRAVSMQAGSAEEAKATAQAGLEEGESISSVQESTVPPPPDPTRGLIA